MSGASAPSRSASINIISVNNKVSTAAVSNSSSYVFKEQQLSSSSQYYSDDLDDNLELNSNATNTSYTSSDISSSIFLNDLTSVEKMSLKLKIFDLQKKLHLLEIEKETIEEYPFKPELHNSYHVKDRERSFLDNLEKGSQIRQQRMQLLTEQVRQEEGYTFRPKITPKAKKLSQAAASSSSSSGNKMTLDTCTQDDDDIISGSNVSVVSVDGADSDSSSLVFQRLFNKAQQKHKRLQDRIDYSLKFDVKTGKRLFTPELNRVSQKYFEGLEETMTTDEYLYREAMDRIATKREIEVRARQEARELSNIKKVTERSCVYLKHRLEKELRGVFDFMLSFASEGTAHRNITATAAVAADRESSMGADSEAPHTASGSTSTVLTASSIFESSISFSDVQAVVEFLVRKAIFPANKLYYVAETVFEILNVNRDGVVTLKSFLKLAHSIVSSTTSTHHPDRRHKVLYGAAFTAKRNPKDNNLAEHDNNEDGDDDSLDALEDVIDYNSLSYSTSTRDGTTLSLSGQQQETISSYVQSQRIALFKKFMSSVLYLYRNRALPGAEEAPRPPPPADMTFHPKINTRSESLAKKKVEVDKQKLLEFNIPLPPRPLEGVDLMYLRSKIKDEKIILQRKQKAIVEQGECTFRPKINATTPSSDATSSTQPAAPSTPVFQRLFDKSVEKVLREQDTIKSKEGALSPKEIDDNRECTFNPTVNREVIDVNKADLFSIKGVPESVNRVRKSRNDHFADAEEEAKKSTSQYLDEKYIKGRQKLLQTGPQAPKLSHGGDKTLTGKDKDNKMLRLNIDIKLGPNKVVALPIYHDEIPSEVADRFCKVYGLAGDALNIIRGVIEDNLSHEGAGSHATPSSPLKSSIVKRETASGRNIMDVNTILSNISKKM